MPFLECLDCGKDTDRKPLWKRPKKKPRGRVSRKRIKEMGFKGFILLIHERTLHSTFDLLQFLRIKFKTRKVQCFFSFERDSTP